MKRRFIDAPQELRCKAVCILRDKSEAQCGRYAKVDGLCRQHHEIAAAKLIAAAQDVLPILKTYIEEIGGCDHSVGICCCEVITAAKQLDTALVGITKPVTGAESRG